MKKRFASFLLGILTCILLFGCQNLDYTLTKKSSIEKRIEATRIETQTKLTELNIKELGLLKSQIQLFQDRLQDASNTLFKGSIVSQSVTIPTRKEMVVSASIERTMLILPPATSSSQQKTLEELKVELNESLISNESLKARYEKELNELRVAQSIKTAELEKAKSDLTSIQIEKTQVIEKALEKEKFLQDQRSDLGNRAIALSKKEADDAKKNERIKMWLIGILLLGATACGLGAAFLPIPQLKLKLIIGVAICGTGALLIPFIEPWMVMTVIGLAAITLAIFILKNYHTEYSAATNTYRGIQEIKDKSGNIYEKYMKPKLSSWNTKINKKSGAIMADQETISHIDDRLIHVGDK